MLTITNHIKNLNIINNNNLFNVPNEGHTRCDTGNDYFDIIDCAFVTQKLVPFTSSINNELYIPFDHL